jgi:hypothetical protein
MYCQTAALDVPVARMAGYYMAGAGSPVYGAP